MHLRELLEQLRKAYEAKALRVSSTLLLGLSAEEVVSRCKWFPGNLPDELLALYAWRDGQDDRTQGASPRFWFRDMVFLPVERAAKEYASMVESYANVFPPNVAGVDLKKCFPFAAFSGGWYVFPCNGQALSSAHPRPIISVFQGVKVFYFSMDSMLRTCIEWVRHPDYRKDGSLPAKIEMEIWKRNNPGIFA